MPRRRIKFIKSMLVVTGFMLMTPMYVGAADTRQTGMEESVLRKSEAQNVSAAAKAWGITEDEYLRYLEVMQGPRGTWSGNADPILALGVTAGTTEEIKRYAEKYVMQEFERTERELAFQREVTAAWQRLFPNTPRIGKLPSSTQSLGAVQQAATASVPKRVAVVVTQACDGCQSTIQHYAKTVEQGNALQAVDFYIADSSGDDRRLKAWVDQHAIPLTLLKAGKITVNHASEHSAIAQYPTVYERRSDGQWVEKSSR